MVKKGLAMSGKLGSEPLGKFYTGKKPKKRREWRGFKDTWYDYVRWLGYWKTLITFIIKPNNIKGFFRYRWMLNYLALPDFMDRHTEGMRGLQLRMAHQALGLIVTDICGMLGQIFRADPAIGNDKELNKKIVLFDENMMSTLMGGFPNLVWLSVEVPAVYTSSMMSQNGGSYYVDVTHEYGVPSLELHLQTISRLLAVVLYSVIQPVMEVLWEMELRHAHLRFQHSSLLSL